MEMDQNAGENLDVAALLKKVEGHAELVAILTAALQAASAGPTARGAGERIRVADLVTKSIEQMTPNTSRTYAGYMEFSVDTGHYDRGRNGRTAITRLRVAGLLPLSHGGFADDEGFGSGVGFTDLVKRPTRRANDLTPTEMAAGRAELRERLAARDVPLVVCVFKPAVTALLGSAGGPGFQSTRFGSSRVFRMHGPYDATEQVEPVMGELRRALNRD